MDCNCVRTQSTPVCMLWLDPLWIDSRRCSFRVDLPRVVRGPAATTSRDPAVDH
jgi:hypothetical protein